MSKVVTSQGLQDFISTGKPTEVVEKKPPEAPNKKATLDEKLAKTDAPETPEAPPKEEVKLVAAEEKDDNGLEAEDHDLAERAKKRIGKKHYEMKKAQEEAAKAREEAEQDAKLAENLFNERELWRKRAEEAEKALEAKKDPPKPAVAELPLTEPVETDPKYWNDKKEFQLREFLKDHDNWRDEDGRRKAEADRRREQEAAQKAENEKIEANFKDRVEKAKGKFPDWDDVVPKAEVVLPYPVLDYIRRSAYGPELAHFLATHKEVADSIKAMHFTVGIAELRDIETSFKKPAIPAPSEKTTEAPSPATSKTVERQGAPAPITPIPTGGSPVQVDPAKMNFRELRAYERSKALEKRTR